MNAFTLTRFSAAAAVVAATASLLATPVQAQTTEDRPLTRAEVNQQTLAAMRAGEILSGEGRPQGPEAFAVSSKTRAERKAETLQARRNGELPVGGNGTYKASISQQTATAHSTKTREERKAETMEAIRNHETLQPGEFA